MQHHQDRTTSEALTSFGNALQAAQTQLQVEEARLTKATQSLQALLQENAEIKQSCLCNPQQLSRLESLKKEKLKLQHYIAEQRDECAREAQHVEEVRQPRQVLESQREAAAKELAAMKLSYVRRAATVHALVAPTFQPSQQLTAQRALLTQRETEREHRQRLLQQAEVTREDVRREYAALTEADADSSLVPLPSADKRLREGADAAAEDAALASGNSSQTMPSAEDLTARLTAAQEQHAAAAAQHQKNMAALRHARDLLKEELKSLCEEVEAADFAQQTQRQQWEAALNNVQPAACCEKCGGDLAAGFLPSGWSVSM